MKQARMPSEDEWLLNKELKRQLDLPQKIIKLLPNPQYPRFAEDLVVTFTLDGVPFGNEERLPVTYSKNRENSSTGRISYKHTLLIDRAVVSAFPPGTYVYSVQVTGDQQLTVNCKRTGEMYPSAQRQQQQTPVQQYQQLINQQRSPGGSKRASEAAANITAAAKRTKLHGPVPAGPQHSPAPAKAAVFAGTASAAHAPTVQQQFTVAPGSRSMRMRQVLHPQTINMRLPGKLGHRLWPQSSTAAAAKRQPRAVFVQLWHRPTASSSGATAAAAATAPGQNVYESWVECQLTLQPSTGKVRNSAGYKLSSSGLQDQLRKYLGWVVVAAQLVRYQRGRRGVRFEVALADATAAAAPQQTQQPREPAITPGVLRQRSSAGSAARQQLSTTGSQSAPSTDAAAAAAGAPAAAAPVNDSSGYGKSGDYDSDSDADFPASDYESGESDGYDGFTDDEDSLDLAILSRQFSATAQQAQLQTQQQVEQELPQLQECQSATVTQQKQQLQELPAAAAGLQWSAVANDSSGGTACTDVQRDFMLVNQAVTRAANRLRIPAGYATSSFPSLHGSPADSSYDMDVQLILLPAGLAAAPRITPATPGVTMIAEKLHVQVRKCKIREGGPTADTAQQQQQQQQHEAAKGDEAKYRLRYIFQGSLLGCYVLDAAALNGSGCWLVGIAKLGESRMRLMFSTDKPQAVATGGSFTARSACWRTGSGKTGVSVADSKSAAADNAVGIDSTAGQQSFVAMRRKLDRDPVLPKRFLLRHMPELMEEVPRSHGHAVAAELVQLGPGQVDSRSAPPVARTHLKGVTVRRDNRERFFVYGVIPALPPGTWHLVGVSRCSLSNLQLYITPSNALCLPPDDGGGAAAAAADTEQQQQHHSGEAVAPAGGPFLAAAAAEFDETDGLAMLNVGSDDDSDTGSVGSGSSDLLAGLLDSECADEQQGGSPAAADWKAGATVAAATADYTSVEPFRVVQNLHSTPRLPLDLVKTSFPFVVDKAGSAFEEGVPLDVTVVWLPPRMAALLPGIKPLKVLQCSGCRVVRYFSKSRNPDKLSTRYYVMGSALTKAVNDVGREAVDAAARSGSAVAADTPVWLVGLQPVGPSALQLLLTSELPPDSRKYEFKLSKEERMKNRQAAAQQRAADMPAAEGSLGRKNSTKHGEARWARIKPQQGAAAAAGDAGGKGGLSTAGRRLSGSGSMRAAAFPVATGSETQQQKPLLRQHSDPAPKLEPQRSADKQFMHGAVPQSSAKRSKLSEAGTAAAPSMTAAGSDKAAAGAAAAAVCVVPERGSGGSGGLRLPMLSKVRKASGAQGDVASPRFQQQQQQQQQQRQAGGLSVARSQQQQQQQRKGHLGVGSKQPVNVFSKILGNIGHGLPSSTSDTASEAMEEDSTALPARTASGVSMQQQQQQHTGPAPLRSTFADGVGQQAPMSQLQQQQQQRRAPDSSGAFGSVIPVCSSSHGESVKQPAGAAGTNTVSRLTAGDAATAAVQQPGFTQQQQQLWVPPPPPPRRLQPQQQLQVPPPQPRQLQRQQQTPASYLAGTAQQQQAPAQVQPGHHQQQQQQQLPVQLPQQQQQQQQQDFHSFTLQPAVGQELGQQAQQPLPPLPDSPPPSPLPPLPDSPSPLLLQHDGAVLAAAPGGTVATAAPAQHVLHEVLSSSTQFVKLPLCVWRACVPGLVADDSSKFISVQLVDGGSGAVLAGPVDCLARNDGRDTVRLRGGGFGDIVQSHDGAMITQLSLTHAVNGGSPVVSLHILPARPAAAAAAERNAAAADVLPPPPPPPPREAAAAVVDSDVQGQQQVPFVEPQPAAGAAPAGVVVQVAQQHEREQSAWQLPQLLMPASAAAPAAVTCDTAKQDAVAQKTASAAAVAAPDAPHQAASAATLSRFDQSGQQSGQQQQTQQVSPPEQRQDSQQLQHLQQRQAAVTAAAQECESARQVHIKPDPEADHVSSRQLQQQQVVLPYAAADLAALRQHAFGGPQQQQQPVVKLEIADEPVQQQQQEQCQQPAVALHTQGPSGHADAGLSDADVSATPPPASLAATAAAAFELQHDQQHQMRAAAAAAPAVSCGQQSQQPSSAALGGSGHASMAGAASGCAHLQLLPAAQQFDSSVEDALLDLISVLTDRGLEAEQAYECMAAVEQFGEQPQLQAKFMRCQYKMLTHAVRNNNTKLAATILLRGLLQK